MNFLCNPVRLKFSTEGKKFPSWEAGQSWGLQLYQPGYDNGLLFTIRLKVRTIQIGPNGGIGPNSVLVPREPTHAPIWPAHIPAREPNQMPPEPYMTNTSNSSQVSLMGPNIKDDQDPLFNMIINTYRVLNSTRPDLTSSCWLSYDIKPPYYEGIAVPGIYIQTREHRACRQQQKGDARLTLQRVTRQGLCLGNVPQTYQRLCNSRDSIKTTGYLVPPQEN